MRINDFSRGSHIPSVGQCVGCAFRYFDCRVLDFTKMPVLKTIEGFKRKFIVLCEGYEGKRAASNPSAKL